MLNTININLKTDIKTDRPTSLPITLMSQDVNNNQFILRFTSDGESVALDSTYTVEILTKFTKSGASRLTSAVVRQDYATWEFDTAYIAQDETVYNYVYVRKSGNLVVSADANCFVFSVGLSEIDKGSGKVAETYDENYQKHLDEFKENVNFEEIAQAEQARKEAETLREENYEQLIDTALIEADVVEKVDNKVTELTPQINDLTAQLAHKATKTELQAVASGSPKAVSLASQMTDTTKNYVYTGTESGYTAGNWYYHNGTAWTSGGTYQSAGIADSTIEEKHVSSDVFENLPLLGRGDKKTLNLDTGGYTSLISSSVNGYLYIQDLPITQRGKVTAHVRGTGNIQIAFLKKNSNSSFTMLDIQTFPLATGVNVLDTSFVSQGDGTEYLGIVANDNFFTKGTPVGTQLAYMYISSNATPDLIVGSNISTKYRTDLPQTVALYWEVKSKVNQILTETGLENAKADIEDLKNKYNSLDSTPPLSLKSFNMLKFRETEPNFPNVTNDAYFLGRWFEKEVDNIKYAFTINMGAEIYAKFTGTSIGATFLHTAGYYLQVAVSIDGGAFTRFSDVNTISFATGLEDKEHTIRLVVDSIYQAKLWTQHEGIAFKGFTVEAGKTVSPIEPMNKRSLWLGDSITAGYNNLATTSLPSSHSAYQSYPYVVANKLNLTNIRVAFGVSGVTRAGAGGVPSAPNYIDYQADGILTTEQAPDFIVINHGTNDSAATSEVFSDAYRSVINRYRIKYPGIPIICMRPFNGARETEIPLIVGEYDNAFYVDTTGWNITYTDGLHPDVPGHVVAGDNLTLELKNIFGNQYFVV